MNIILLAILCGTLKKIQILQMTVQMIVPWVKRSAGRLASNGTAAGERIIASRQTCVSQFLLLVKITVQYLSDF